VCVFLFVKTCISATLIFHITVNKRIWKFVPELETKSSKLIILSSYREPTGDFNRFIKNLHDTLKHQYKPKTNL
jgi:hypothetical protein